MSFNHISFPSYTTRPHLVPKLPHSDFFKRWKKMHHSERDVRKFLVSHYRQAFELIEPDNCYEDEFIVRRIPYKFTEDVVSHPSAAMRYPQKISLPRELADRIVSHLVRSYIDTREYGQAADALTISKAVLRSWWRWYAHSDADRYLSAEVLMAQLSRTLRLLQSIYDDAYVGEGLGPHLGCHFPCIGLQHPGTSYTSCSIKPHHLVGEMNSDSGVVMTLHEDHGRRIEGYQIPVIMASGPRICDVIVADQVDVDEGVFTVENVIFPILFLKIDTGNKDANDHWERYKPSWKRFADLVRWSMEGCELYMETTREFLEAVPTLSGGKTGRIVKKKTFVKP